MVSAVAGILERRGGLRILITQRFRMRRHVHKGERLFVVPGLEVKEPVPVEDIASLVETVQKHIVKTLAPTNHCGGCNACCVTLYVKDGEFEKPSHTVCRNCAVGFGCKLYNARPKACRSFECAWLKSQKRNDRMAPELRPDRCGAIFTEDTQTNDPLVFEVHGEPNADAWAWINEMQRAGYKAKKVDFYVGEHA